MDGSLDWQLKHISFLRLFFIGLALCFFSGTALANASHWPKIDLSELQRSIPLNPLFQLSIDDSNANLDQALAWSDKRWFFNEKATLNFGQSHYPYWFRFHLTGVDALNEKTFLRLNYPNIDNVDVYFFEGDRLLKTYHVGDALPFVQRPVDHRIFLFPIDDMGARELSVLIRAESQGPIDFPLDIITQKEVYEQDKIELMWMGAYFGVLAMMFLYNVCVGLITREITYLYYLFYVASVAAIQFTLRGLSFQFLWPQSVVLNNSMMLMLTGLMAFSAVLFVVQFIDLKKNGVLLDRVIAYVLLAGYVGIMLGYFVMPYSVVLKIAHSMSFMAIILGIWIGVRAYLNGVKSARIFCIAWFVYFVFIIIYLLGITAVLEFPVISAHALEIGSVFELALLSLAFGDRINEEKEKRLYAQNQALEFQVNMNRELDAMVRKRTEELEQANLELHKLSIHDSLTGVYNRRYFDDAVLSETRRSIRERSWLSIIMMDVDHFKGLNDNYGHPFGDLCLKQVAETIQKNLRRPPDVIARYGGEEFIVLLPGISWEDAEIVAENIRAAIERLVLENGETAVSLTLSAGVCAIQASPEVDAVVQVQRMIEKADVNLYAAKQGGRNRIIANQ